MNTQIEKPLIYLPPTKLSRRAVARFFAARSQNGELNVSVRTRQALILLALALAFAALCGIGVLARQAHHRAVGKGSVMDNFFIKETPTCEAG